MIAAALLLAATGTPTAVLTAGAILSAGVALAVPGLIATIAGQTTNTNRGLALAVYTFTMFFGASVAPPVAQALATYGTGPVWLLPAVLVALAIFAVTASTRSRSLSASPRR